MDSLRTIEIDLDIHKLIETERRSFTEEPRHVLRRLLGFGEAPPLVSTTSGRSWTGSGVELPHGTQLRMTYNGVTHEGEIVNGVWRVEGGDYTSPSGAAKGVARTKKGGKTNLDGWGYWHAKPPGASTWTLLFDLWKRTQGKAK